jgi:hypothetical protein
MTNNIPFAQLETCITTTMTQHLVIIHTSLPPQVTWVLIHVVQVRYDGGYHFNILGILACVSEAIFDYETFDLETMPFTLFKCWWLSWGTQVDGHP